MGMIDLILYFKDDMLRNFMFSSVVYLPHCEQQQQIRNVGQYKFRSTAESSVSA